MTMHKKATTKPDKRQASKNLQAALDLAAKGFAVIPLGPDKRPLIKGWQAKATTDPVIINDWFLKWPKAMPGLPTGERNGFTVLDIDKKNGKDGFAELEDIELDVDSMSPVQVETPSGGRHVYFAWEGQGNSAAGLPSGLDVRGQGGFVVAPNAVNGNGVYRLLKGRIMRDLPKWPVTLPIRKRSIDASNSEPTGLPFRVMRKALMACPNDGQAYATRDDWLAVLMALHCETGGSDDGLSLAHEWSQQHASYDPDKTDAAWLSCRSGGLTGWYIIREAEGHGWSDPAVTELREIERREGAESDFDFMLTPEEEYEIAEMVRPSDDLRELLGEPEPSPLTFLTPADCASLPARPYVIKGLLGAGDIAAIVGAPGAGKSLLAPRLAYAVAQGEPVFGKRVKQGGVFYVAAEDGHGMRARLSALRGDFGDADQLHLVSGVSDLLSKKGEILELQKAAKDRRPKLIIIDTLAVAFPGLEENSAEGMGLVVKAARSLAKWGAAVVLIHHDTKAGDGLPRGHSLLNGALDVSIHIKKDGGVVTAKPSKNRNGTTEDVLAFKIKTRVIGEDEDGDAITTAICEEADASDGVSKEVKLSKSVDAALSILRELGHGTQWVSEDDWRKACVEGRKVSPSEKDDTRRAAFRRAMGELVRLGKVTFSEGRFIEDDQSKEEFTSDFDGI